MHPRKCSSSPPIGSDGGEHASPAQNPTAKIYLLLALTRIAYSPPPRPPLRRSPHASAMVRLSSPLLSTHPRPDRLLLTVLVVLSGPEEGEGPAAVVQAGQVRRREAEEEEVEQG